MESLFVYSINFAESLQQTADEILLDRALFNLIGKVFKLIDKPLDGGGEGGGKGVIGFNQVYFHRIPERGLDLCVVSGGFGLGRLSH